ncbi:uncharacterized protein G2W53_002548 [Senna tora]|uniref:RNase H type-1 domain-containing protein n=1 Tax=Senna tora TaxID=362788 RepID=A0A834X8T3_9FABA|nr:uncharacterized protein G2W53_002548 [Senna tora]
MKLNTDVAKLSENEWSIGVVLRSHQGRLFMVAIKTILAPDDVAVAEALGVRWGLQLAKQCSIYKLEAETDCAVVANYFTNVSTFDLSIVNDIMSDCQQLGASFDSFSFKHIYRECNQVAHCVAKHLHPFSPCVWFEDFPISVLHLANSDVSC